MKPSNPSFFTLIGRISSDSTVADDACCGTSACDNAPASSCCESNADKAAATQPSTPIGGCGCR